MFQSFIILLITLFISFFSFCQFSSYQQIVHPEYFEATIAKSADIDNDFDLDIVLASSTSLFWYRKMSNGEYESLKEIDNAIGNALDIEIMDLEGDGDLDILLSEYNADKIVYYENLGMGTFGPKQTITNQTNGVKIINLADLDNDNDSDLISMSVLDGKIAWYQNQGNGQFGNQIVIDSSVYGLSGMSATDVDNDGNIDIVRTLQRNFEDTIVGWYKNTGGGNFIPNVIPITISPGRINQLVIADIDNNNTNDIIFSINDDTDTIKWLQNLGSGVFAPLDTITTLVNGIVFLDASDIDGDALPEVLSVSQTDDKIAFYRKNISGDFGNQNTILVLNDPHALYCDDINQDGQKDLISISSEKKVALHFGQGNDVFSSGTGFETYMDYPKKLVTSDFDNDGDEDIAIASLDNNSLRWFKNLGNGYFSTPKIVADNVTEASGIYAADLDNDGWTDILSASQGDAKIAWYQNLGNGTFGPQQVLSNQAYYTQVVKTADIDHDGDQDVIFGWCNGGMGGKVEICINQGSGIFSTAQVLSNSCCISIEIADIDNDSYEDIVFASSTLIWLKNFGNGNFSLDQVIDASLNESFVEAADIDLDGDIDVLASKFSSPKHISWYENLGGGTFGPNSIITTQVNRTSALFMSDLDNDGDEDLILSDRWQNNTDIAWFENLGSGSWGQINTVATPHGETLAVISTDLDGDSDKDLIAAACCGGSNYNLNYLNWYENYLIDPDNIQGDMYFDGDQDGMRSITEPGIPQIPVVTNPIGPTCFTYSNGNYLVDFDNMNQGSYVIQPLLPVGWSISSDSINYHISTTQLPTYNASFDFGIFPTTVFDSINTYLTGSFPRCNDTVDYWLTVVNDGTTIPTGLIHLELDDSITFINSTPSPDSIIGQNIYWGFDSLNFFASQQILLIVALPDFQSTSDTLVSSSRVFITDSLNVLHFIAADTLSQILVCAYDPNDKIVLPRGIDSSGYIPMTTTELEYTIRFQNTGNDTAAIVVIEDQLDHNLDWQSLDILAYSHYVETTIDPFGKITFRFPDINLPDSNVNELFSHGFVRYKIRLKPNLLSGTQIHNSANIYFDQNPAVVTNTTINTLYQCGLSDEIPYITSQCEGTTVMFDGILSTTNFVWNITDGNNGNGSAFNWTPDSAGTFNVHILADNQLCHLDTVFPISVPSSVMTTLPEIWICQGDSVQLFGIYRLQSGNYRDTLQTIYGCDSIVEQSLQQFTIPEILDLGTVYGCHGDSVNMFGEYYTVAGVFNDTLQTINGCDSIISQTLSFYEVNEEITFDTLSESIFCLQNSPFALPQVTPSNGVYSGQGVLNGLFDPSTAGVGHHTVFYDVSDTNGCITSDSLILIVEDCASVWENDGETIRVYPNPFSDHLFLSIPEKLKGKSVVRILDVEGEIVYSNSQFQGNLLLIQPLKISSGTYMIQLIDMETAEMIWNNLIIAK